MKNKIAYQRNFVVSLIGRPNVGKSSIFNRLLHQQHKAITFNRPGVTRDRHYALASLDDYSKGEEQVFNYVLVDTGGFYPTYDKEDHPLEYSKDAKPFFHIMGQQAKLAIEESDLILFVMDVREGLNPLDEDICQYLRKAKKPFLTLLNKYDTDKQAGDEGDFYSLGLDDFLKVSAEHSTGFLELKESIISFFKQQHESNEVLPTNEKLQKGVLPDYQLVGNVAIIGAPNAGKSTLLNTLVGAERSLVSPVAGTTADPIETFINLDFESSAKDLKQFESDFSKIRQERQEIQEDLKAREEEKVYEKLLVTMEKEAALEDNNDVAEVDETELLEVSAESTEIENIESEETVSDDDFERLSNWKSVRLVDTAGIRRKSRVDGTIEEKSVYRSLRAISESDVVICLVDVGIGLTHHDRRLCDIAFEKGKSVVITLNKIDLHSDIFQNEINKREFLLDLRDKLPWLDACEIIHISAKERTSIRKLKKSLVQTLLVRKRAIKTGELNRCIQGLVGRNSFYLPKSRHVEYRVKYASMVKADPPTFILFGNGKKGVPTNFRRYLVNGIRNHFKIRNTPVHLLFRN
ncbi:50S ribosome-binding GTPase [Bacteriovoracaceae bacterium]|nr:50S ribosome-binding GTPase [Bacteriovoracaceae bacterium]